MGTRQLQVNHGGNYAEFIDDSGCGLVVTLFSNNRCNLMVTNGKGRANSVSLNPRAAHELRDLLNKRYPNATAVQSDK